MVRSFWVSVERCHRIEPHHPDVNIRTPPGGGCFTHHPDTRLHIPEQDNVTQIDRRRRHPPRHLHAQNPTTIPKFDSRLIEQPPLNTTIRRRGAAPRRNSALGEGPRAPPRHGHRRSATLEHHETKASFNGRSSPCSTIDIPTLSDRVTERRRPFRTRPSPDRRLASRPSARRTGGAVRPATRAPSPRQQAVRALPLPRVPPGTRPGPHPCR